MLQTLRDAFVGDRDLTERQGTILVALAGVVFSFTAIAFRAVESASDFQFLTYRGGSTFVAMVLLILLRRSGRAVSFKGVTWKTWLAGLILATASMVYILALARTSATITLFMLAAAPVVAALLGRLALGEAVNRDLVIAITLTAIGIGVMVSGGLGVGSLTGLVLAGTIPFLVGSYNVITRSVAGVDPVVPTIIAAGFLTLGCAAVAMSQTGIGVSWQDAGLATVSGGVALGVGLPLFNLGHRSVSAAKASLLIMTEVILAPLWVWIWPGEQPSIQTLAGGSIVLAAVARLVARAYRQAKNQPEESVPAA